jgi:hypothetical protein
VLAFLGFCWLLLEENACKLTVGVRAQIIAISIGHEEAVCA